MHYIFSISGVTIPGTSNEDIPVVVDIENPVSEPSVNQEQIEAVTLEDVYTQLLVTNQLLIWLVLFAGCLVLGMIWRFISRLVGNILNLM